MAVARRSGVRLPSDELAARARAQFLLVDEATFFFPGNPGEDLLRDGSFRLVERFRRPRHGAVMLYERRGQPQRVWHDRPVVDAASA